MSQPSRPKPKHQWFVCTMCGPTVRCATCGNNSCNGGYGFWPKGSTLPCPDCPSAYEQQDQETPPTEMVRQFAALQLRRARAESTVEY